MYLIEHYVIKFVSDLQQVMVSSTNETDRQNITNIVKSGIKDHHPKFKLGILGNYIYKIGGTQRE